MSDVTSRFIILTTTISATLYTFTAGWLIKLSGQLADIRERLAKLEAKAGELAEHVKARIVELVQ